MSQPFVCYCRDIDIVHNTCTQLKFLGSGAYTLGVTVTCNITHILYYVVLKLPIYIHGLVCVYNSRDLYMYVCIYNYVLYVASLSWALEGTLQVFILQTRCLWHKSRLIACVLPPSVKEVPQCSSYPNTLPRQGYVARLLHLEALISQLECLSRCAPSQLFGKKQTYWVSFTTVSEGSATMLLLAKYTSKARLHSSLAAFRSPDQSTWLSVLLCTAAFCLESWTVAPVVPLHGDRWRFKLL